jgi:diacylglycerol kinase (ATP)
MRGLNNASSQYRDAVVIYNPYAGRLVRGQRLLQRTIEIFERQGTRARLVPTIGPQTASLLARRYVEEGADLIVAAGGDGTINEIINGIVHSQVPLAILPGGTANVLAHELKMRGGFEMAAANLSQLSPVRVSVGLMRGEGYERHFLMMAGVGLDAQIVYDLNLDLKAVAGKLAYYAGGFRQVFRPLPQFDAHVLSERRRVGFALVSRVRNYGGDLEIARGASLLRPDFEVVLFEGEYSPGYLRYMAGVVLGYAERLQGCIVAHTNSIACDAPSNGGVRTQVDGELGCKLPVTIEIVPQAVTLLVPPAYLSREQARQQVAALA